MTKKTKNHTQDKPGFDFRGVFFFNVFVLNPSFLGREGDGEEGDEDSERGGEGGGR